MIVDISNELYSELCTLLDGIATISRPTQGNPTTYPYVTFDDFDNGDLSETKDSGGVRHTEVAYEIQIYAKGNSSMSDAKVIKKLIDSKMSGEFGFLRTLSTKVPNYLDDSIYRYVVRYEGILNENEKIFN